MKKKSNGASPCILSWQSSIRLSTCHNVLWRGNYISTISSDKNLKTENIIVFEITYLCVGPSSSIFNFNSKKSISRRNPSRTVLERKPSSGCRNLYLWATNLSAFDKGKTGLMLPSGDPDPDTDPLCRDSI